MAMTFEENLCWGGIGESQIAKWLRSRGHSVLPIYEKEIDNGKGPRFFTPGGQIVAPDLFVMPRMEWIEAKHKSVFTWHRKTQRWVTGIDLNHYEEYKRARTESGCKVFLMFLHRLSTPDARDLRHGCPAVCPTGLFAGDLDRLQNEENHRHDNWGRHGMVYWAVGRLKKMAEIEDMS
jgi:hypothetical protein